jgi:hypothetical protein
MTTGLEVGAAIFGLIAGAIDITHKAVEIYNAVEDKAGIPESLKKVSEKLPSVEGLLKDAEAQWKGSRLDTTDEQTTRDLEHCKELCQKLHDLLLSVYPKTGSGRGERLLKGTRTVFSSKAKTAEGLMKEIREHLDTLMSRQLICNAATLKDLKSMGNELLKGQGFAQQQCALISDGTEHHEFVSHILKSWITRPRRQTSSVVPSSTKLLAFWSCRPYAKCSLAIDSSGLTTLQRIYTRITDYDPKVINRRLSVRKAASTNSWLLDRDDFKSWLHGDMNPQSHLWLSGKGRELIRSLGARNVLTHRRSWLRKEHSRVSQTMPAILRVLTIAELLSSTSAMPNVNPALSLLWPCSSSKTKETRPFYFSRA